MLLSRKLDKRCRKLQVDLLPDMYRCRLESGGRVLVLGSIEVSIYRFVEGRGSSIVRVAEVEGLLVVVVVVDLLSVAELVSAEDFLAEVALAEGRRDLAGWSSMEVEVAGSRLKTYLFLQGSCFLTLFGDLYERGIYRIEVGLGLMEGRQI